MEPALDPTADARPAPAALVTGGAIRVGRAIVEGLADAGYRVWIHYGRSRAEAERLRDALNERGRAPLGIVAADLVEPRDREALAAEVVDPSGPAGGRLDLLVHSAAGFERGAFETRTDADLRRVLELNLVAPLSLTRALLPALRRAPEPASVVHILDLLGIHPVPGFLDHGASKAALAMATRALAIELAPIRVNGIAPGTVAWPDDPRYAPGQPARDRILERIPRGRIGEPADIAQAVLFMAGAPHVSGQVLAVDGGSLAAIAGAHG